MTRQAPGTTLTTIRRNGLDVIVDASNWTEVARLASEGKVGMRITRNATVEFYLAPTIDRKEAAEQMDADYGNLPR
ncbi:MAG: hypothetical protein ACYS7Y_26995 [Planctomycetota bacterium]|jgi:hypothetical protein